MPASPIELKNSLPDLDLNPGWWESSAYHASRHCGLISGLIQWATEDWLLSYRYTKADIAPKSPLLFKHQNQNTLVLTQLAELYSQLST